MAVFAAPGSAAMVSAAIIYYYAQRAVQIHDTFLFSPDLENLGKWYRQLLAESIGKELIINGEKHSVGIMPTVSIGSTDLHSMAQFYLSGNRDLFTSFVTVNRDVSGIVIPHALGSTHAVDGVQGKKLSTVMQAIFGGVQIAYQNAQRPFVTWELPGKNSYYCGQWMQYKMLEVMYLGLLFGINTFDQPQVELYKQETRKLLSV